MLSITVFNDFIDMKYVIMYYMKKGDNMISFFTYKNLPEGYILKMSTLIIVECWDYG